LILHEECTKMNKDKLDKLEDTSTDVENLLVLKASVHDKHKCNDFYPNTSMLMEVLNKSQHRKTVDIKSNGWKDSAVKNVSSNMFNNIDDGALRGRIDTDKKVTLLQKDTIAQSETALSPVGNSAIKVERVKRKTLTAEEHIRPQQQQFNKKRRTNAPLPKEIKINPFPPPGLHPRSQDTYVQQLRPTNGHVVHRSTQHLFFHMLHGPSYHRTPLDPKPPVLGNRIQSQHHPPSRLGTGSSIFVCNLPQVFRNPVRI